MTDDQPRQEMLPEGTAAYDRYLLHPDTVQKAARDLERADLRLRYDLTWREMDEPEQEAFVEAARVVLTSAAEGLREPPS